MRDVTSFSVGDVIKMTLTVYFQQSAGIRLVSGVLARGAEVMPGLKLPVAMRSWSVRPTRCANGARGVLLCQAV